MLPFTPSEFFAVFARYNDAVWPVQVVFILAAAVAVFALRRSNGTRTRPMLALLALLWLWMGIVYHALFFRPINPLAAGFAAMFVAQGALLAIAAWRPSFRLVPASDPTGLLGWALVAFALILYPLIGYATGHRYPASPTFGLPCPTTIFTLGVLLWARPARPWLLVVPLVWSLIGFTAALRLGVYEDSGLLVAAVATMLVVFASRRSRQAPG
jgi:hypothetical protein